MIDGGSNDGTVEAVQAHGNRLTHFITEPDEGIYDAMNKGLALATGKVIGFLNADDFYANPYVLSQVADLMERHDLDILYGDVAFYQQANPGRLVRRYSSSRFRPDRLAWGWMPAHPAMFIKNEVFKAVGPFRINYKIAGDFEFVARVFTTRLPRYLYIPEVIVHMCTGGISTSGLKNTLLLNKEVLQACRENGINSNFFKIASKYPLKLLEYLYYK